MTFDNSILLKIKQSNGIQYNDLFNSIISHYNNNNSARAALSRSLKNLEAFGQIKRDDSRIIITDKGLASINIEMKDKLVMKLNEQIKKPIDNLEELVKLLIIISQRGEIDSDLLKNARDNSSFTITDLEDVRKQIHEKKKSLAKLDSVLANQIIKLKQLEFNDTYSEKISPNLAKRISNEISGEIMLEFSDKQLEETIQPEWKKQNKIIIQPTDIEKLFLLLEKNPLSKVTLYMSGIKAIIYGEKITFYGQYSSVKKFVNLEQKE
jgi:superfamily II helicase